MRKQLLVQDSLSCYGVLGENPINLPHAWAYNGRADQTYTCLNCGRYVTNALLIEGIEPEVENA